MSFSIGYVWVSLCTCVSVHLSLGSNGSSLSKVLGGSMVLDYYEFREYILPHHKNILDLMNVMN